MVMSKTWRLYKFSIPTGEYYFGSTRNRLCERKSAHKTKLRSNSHIPQLQKWYNQGGSLDDMVFEELDTGDQYKIKCAEHSIVKDHIDGPKCLNKQVPWPPEVVKVLIEEGYDQAIKHPIIQSWSKTTAGRMNDSIQNARKYIKMYSKQNRPNMVKKWEGLLEERLKIKDE